MATSGEPPRRCVVCAGSMLGRRRNALVCSTDCAAARKRAYEAARYADPNDPLRLRQLARRAARYADPNDDLRARQLVRPRKT